MPWQVIKSGDRYKVIQMDNGHIVGSHDTREKAEEHKRALYANVKHEDKK